MTYYKDVDLSEHSKTTNITLIDNFNLINI
ncbi:hypothetical protein SAMN05421766_103642 [Zobellia uliginosa]|uniref:Uncharacterized protein n=1 Tax=Zobellia uliginosa TaxID=143224 RepID=A0ABY1KWE5_9FLAO|nr:hypothetical protein SAMN05421766_103642 [Zobellia uliginosa]